MNQIIATINEDLASAIAAYHEAAGKVPTCRSALDALRTQASSYQGQLTNHEALIQNLQFSTPAARADEVEKIARQLDDARSLHQGFLDRVQLAKVAVAAMTEDLDRLTRAAAQAKTLCLRLIAEQLSTEISAGETSAKVSLLIVIQRLISGGGSAFMREIALANLFPEKKERDFLIQAQELEAFLAEDATQEEAHE